ncbi:unnamed protein product [Nippostrongylus brasiliensis]|uniref:Glycine N-acyltransferase-like protein n=1 Tax=Nippostrongylus brasiliensis TaxID=27835 RepID=A0A0N4YIN0_NIPBR|nr:unnamed protein product [Nippostrongylus brasiliensis]
MPELVQHTAVDDLQTIMDTYSEDPLFYCLWHSIKFELDGTFPNTKLSLLSYRFSNGSVLLVGHKRNKITSDFIILYLRGSAQQHELDDAFTELFKLFPINDRKVFMGEEQLIKAACNYFSEKLNITKVHPYPTRVFYMTREQMDLAQSMQSPDLPEGYTLGCSDPKLDAEIITKTWRHSTPNEVEQTRAKLTCFPSSCVRFNGAPVGFEMVDHIGSLNHLFVLEEHRRKGLGNIIELDLARKITRTGCKVFKFVELFNKSVIAGSAQSPLWTTLVDRDGNDVTYVFLGVLTE